METLGTIAVHFPEDEQYIKVTIESRLSGTPCGFAPVPGGFVVKADMSGMGTPEKNKYRALVKRLQTTCYHISFYNIKKMNTNYPGSASPVDWHKHIPRTGAKPNYLWNHDLIRFPQGIKKAVDSGALDKSKGHGGSEITVCQFDTGWSNHPGLIGYPGYNKSKAKSFIPSLNSAKDGLYHYDLAGKGFQKPGHATATAGTMIASGEIDSGNWPVEPDDVFGLPTVFKPAITKGLFPYVNFIPIRLSETVTLGGGFARALLPGVGHAANLVDALEYATQQNADVVTMSMGGSLMPNKVRRAYRKAYENGLIMVCAAGNSKKADKVFNVVKPARYPFTIAAAGVEPVNRSNKWSYMPWNQSCDGKEVDISAPARYIYALFAMEPKRVVDQVIKADLGDGFKYKFGGATSQATVHVASAAALWKCYYRSVLNDANSDFQKEKWRIPEAFRYAILASRNTPDYWKRNERLEFKGILNAEAMLNAKYSPTSKGCQDYLKEVKKHFQRDRWEIYSDLFGEGLK